MSTLWVYLDCKDVWMILTRYVWILDGLYYICVRFKWILCSFSWNLNKIWISLVSFFTIWACLDFNEIWMWNIWRFLLHRLASFSSTNEKPESHRLNQDQVFSLKSRHVRGETRLWSCLSTLKLRGSAEGQKPQLKADLTHFCNSAAPPCFKWRASDWGLTSPTTDLWHWFPSQQLAVRWEELKRITEKWMSSPNAWI